MHYKPSWNEVADMWIIKKEIWSGLRCRHFIATLTAENDMQLKVGPR